MSENNNIEETNHLTGTVDLIGTNTVILSGQIIQKEEIFVSKEYIQSYYEDFGTLFLVVFFLVLIYKIIIND